MTDKLLENLSNGTQIKAVLFLMFSRVFVDFFSETVIHRLGGKKKITRPLKPFSSAYYRSLWPVFLSILMSGAADPKPGDLSSLLPACLLFNSPAD